MQTAPQMKAINTLMTLGNSVAMPAKFVTHTDTKETGWTKNQKLLRSITHNFSFPTIANNLFSHKGLDSDSAGNLSHLLIA